MLVQYLKYNHTKYYLKALYGQWDIRWMLNETRTHLGTAPETKKNVFKDVTLPINHLSWKTTQWFIK
jgi:hypothetical protein